MSSFTETAIKSSFLKLLDQKPLSSITVKDIVEDCGINRNSFYYHYHDIPSLLEEMITDEATKITSEYRTFDSIEDCLAATVDFALEHRRAVLHIYTSISRDVYEDYLWKILMHLITEHFDMLCKDIKVKDEDREIIVSATVCQCFGMIIKWMREGMTDDIRSRFARFWELYGGITESAIRKSTER